MERDRGREKEKIKRRQRRRRDWERVWWKTKKDGNTACPFGTNDASLPKPVLLEQIMYPFRKSIPSVIKCCFQ